MAALLLLAKTMFPEGQQRVQAVRKDGAAAPLVNALIVNAKDAIDELWKARGYVPMKGAQIKQRLGYALDREEALGYVVTSALALPLLSPPEARTIGKRARALLGEKGAIGKELALLTKRGHGTAALMRSAASLSLAPPKQKAAKPAAAPPQPPPPPQLPPPPPQPQSQPPLPPPPPSIPPPPPEAVPRVADHLDWICKCHIKAVASATRRADRFEDVLRERLTWDDPYGRTLEDEECEARELEFKAALIRLSRKIPELEICPDEYISGLHAHRTMTRLCPCGQGRLPIAPWVPRWEELGFCWCDDSHNEMREWRDVIREANEKLANCGRIQCDSHKPGPGISREGLSAFHAQLGLTERFVRS